MPTRTPAEARAYSANIRAGRERAWAAWDAANPGTAPHGARRLHFRRDYRHWAADTHNLPRSLAVEVIADILGVSPLDLAGAYAAHLAR